MAYFLGPPLMRSVTYNRESMRVMYACWSTESGCEWGGRVVLSGWNY